MSVDISWCKDTVEKNRYLYFYLGSTDDSPLEHQIVLNSYSPEQLGFSNDGYSDDCEGMRSFADISRVLGSEVKSPLYVEEGSNFTVVNSSTSMYPCGFRSLLSIRRRLML